MTCPWTQGCNLGSLANTHEIQPSRSKFYRDLPVFVVFPCAPSETTELFFSLYN